MDLGLQGKTALVTGASGGIGEVIAQTLANEGARIAVHGRRAEAVSVVVGSIRQAGGEAFPVLGDLATDAGAQAVHDAATAGGGRIDILVNNAGAYLNRSWDAITPDDWLST